MTLPSAHEARVPSNLVRGPSAADQRDDDQTPREYGGSLLVPCHEDAERSLFDMGIASCVGSMYGP